MIRKLSILAAVASLSLTSPSHAGPAVPPPPPAADGKPAENPAAAKSIAEIVAASPEHKTLAALLSETGLISAFRSGGTFTLFAPTDAAFAKLGQAKLDDLKKPQNRSKLMEILTSHAALGKILAADVKTGDVEMMNQKKIPAKVDGETITIGNATVTTADLAATNGVVHVLDAVIVPK